MQHISHYLLPIAEAIDARKEKGMGTQIQALYGPNDLKKQGAQSAAQNEPQTARFDRCASCGGTHMNIKELVECNAKRMAEADAANTVSDTSNHS